MRADRGAAAEDASSTEMPPNVRVVTALPADHAGYDTTDARTMAALARAEDAHFWFRARAALLVARLGRLGVKPPARVVDLGCGRGGVSARLAEAGYEVTGVDGHPSLVYAAARRAPNARFVVADLARGPGVEENAYAACGFFDVIEHLDDPRAALEAGLRVVEPGGFVVGTVPALMSLWSRVDEVSGHKLRYDRRTLSALPREVRGASLVEIVDFNRALVPLMWLARRRLVRGDDGAMMEENLDVPARPVNAALHALLRLEYAAAPLLDVTRLPGASLWFALRRCA